MNDITDIADVSAGRKSPPLTSNGTVNGSFAGRPLLAKILPLLCEYSLLLTR